MDTLNQWIDRLADDPVIAVKYDCIGAALSFILLVVVLPFFSDDFGVPVLHFRLLSLIPFVIVLGELQFLARGFPITRKTLAIIASINASYCLISLAYLVARFATISDVGLLYFCLDIAVILTIVAIEVAVIRKMKSTTTT